MSFALRNAAHTASLVACTPIFLPIMSSGVLIGVFLRLITANGFFWYCAPMILRSAPLLMADDVMSGAEMHTNALPDCTTASCCTVGPPESSSTLLKPCFL